MTLVGHRRDALVLLVVAATAALLLGAPSLLPAPDRAHDVVLLAHLASLLLGFGAVLVMDWHGLLWMLGRVHLTEVLTVTARLTVPVWLGLAGLVSTGALLAPDTGAPLTRLKLALVALVAVNGLQAQHLHRAMVAAQAAGRVPGRLLLRGLSSGAVSQLGWWGATVIGLLNAS
jgi:hypothetical protein